MAFKKKAVLLVIIVLVVAEIVFISNDIPLKTDILSSVVVDIKKRNASEVDLEPRADKPLHGQEEMEAFFKAREQRVEEVDCRKVVEGDEQELKKAKAVEEGPPTHFYNDTQIHTLATDCPSFMQKYGFITDPLTERERDFPIAYSVIAYQYSSQVVDLLKVIYRPQNFYCVHVDRKAKKPFKLAMNAVCRCLPNVFVASESVSVRWSRTVLDPEIVCMGDLWSYPSWKYFINLTGQEFPLKTNYELVRILQVYKGVNDIMAGIPSERARDHRWASALPAPHNITLYKGAVHIAASRAFVDYALHSKVAQDFLQWCKGTRHSDEHFFNSLNHNHHLPVPGRYTANVTETGDFRFNDMPHLMRYKNWVPRYRCPGHFVRRTICILCVLDVPQLNKRKEMFANKFYADYSHLALRCLAEELFNRTRDQTLGRIGFDVSFYRNFTLNRVPQE